MTEQSAHPPVTIYDVAKAAGVAPSTVSRTFARPGRVNADTAARVRAAAEQLGYRANPIGHAAGSRTRMLGVMVSDVANPFHATLIRGAQLSANAAGYELLLLDCRESGVRERTALERVGADLVSWHTMGEGFTWETQDKARDIAAAGAAWDKAKELMADPTLRLLVLDELNIALRYDYLDLADVVATLSARRPDLHVVVTGRNAKPEMIEAADLVTEMTLVKHHFAAGVKAQEGIEF